MSASPYCPPDGIEPRRIAVVHAEPLLAAGLSRVFNAWGHTVVSWAAAGPSPDLLVADAAAAAEALAQPGRGPGVLVVESAWRAAPTRDLLARGVVGCLQSGCTLAQLAEAVACATAGRRYLCPVVAELLVADVGGPVLTPREREVLRLVCDGLNNKTIALRLGLALTTVKSHVKALLAKSATRSRTEMAATALRGAWL